MIHLRILWLPETYFHTALCTSHYVIEKGVEPSIRVHHVVPAFEFPFLCDQFVVGKSWYALSGPSGNRSQQSWPLRGSDIRIWAENSTFIENILHVVYSQVDTQRKILVKGQHFNLWICSFIDRLHWERVGHFGTIKVSRNSSIYKDTERRTSRALQSRESTQYSAQKDDVFWNELSFESRLICIWQENGKWGLSNMFYYWRIGLTETGWIACK